MTPTPTATQTVTATSTSLVPKGAVVSNRVGVAGGLTLRSDRENRVLELHPIFGKSAAHALPTTTGRNELLGLE